MTPIVIFVTILLAWVALNWYVIRILRITPHHLTFAAIRSLLLLVNAIVFYAFPEWLYFFVAELCMFWFPFHVLLNVFRGKPIHYFGERPADGSDYSFIDEHLRRWPSLSLTIMLMVGFFGVWLISNHV